MRTRFTTTAFVLAVAVFGAMSSGCGNFSNQDLIFLAALPQRDNVAIRLPGQSESQSSNSLTQGLSSCGETDLYCNARLVSDGLNAGVFFLLDLVDKIALENAPTVREPNRRVWGPTYILGQNLSVRFEMTRKTMGTTDYFEYCLHGKRGNFDRDAMEGIGCGSEVHDSGFVRLLHGSFEPDAERGGARYGVGTLVLDLNALRDSGMGKPTDQGRLVIDYDNTEEQTSIGLHIQDVDEGGLLPAQAYYCYHRNADGSGFFVFTLQADFVPSLFPAQEQLSISARWDETGAGRADANISGGDLAGTVISATQCWDGELESVYYTDSGNEHPTEGESAYCVYSDPLGDVCPTLFD